MEKKIDIRKILDALNLVSNSTDIIVEAIFCYASEEIAFEIVWFCDDGFIEVIHRIGIVFFREVDASHQYEMFVV